MTLEVRPVTAERWDDLERLFGPSGAYSGCWCMYLRIKASEWEANGNAALRMSIGRAALHAATRSNPC